MLIQHDGSINIAREKLGYIGPTPYYLQLKREFTYGNIENIIMKIIEVCKTLCFMIK